MSNIIIPIIYMISCIFFIRGIKLLGKAATARRGNLISSLGMLIAVVTVLAEKEVLGSWSSNPLENGYVYIICALLIGTLIGAVWALKVKMTGMPELVALFNGFGGLSSFLVAISQYIAKGKTDFFTDITLSLTVAVGAVAFTGSLVAWGKLSGKAFKGQSRIPMKNALNVVLCLSGIAASVFYAMADGERALYALITVSAAFLLVGFTLVMPIGGGDMPVIISLLNALSGLAASFAGLAINNTVLVVSGCLVGASGLILTLIMCKAMNRTLYALLFHSFGGSSAKKGSGEEKEPKSLSVEDAFPILEAANSVCIIPGYGMAVAQAQHAVKELVTKLEDRGTEVNFAIHPVAGRMPGHMNVLLAEADVPYEQLKTAEEMNPQMDKQDVAIVVGANDVVNPAARNDSSSPIYGMPVINADKARTVFVLKRGRGKGFSGLENPLFTNDNTVMIYGDAKQTLQGFVNEFEN